jgi:hypothetical protein
MERGPVRGVIRRARRLITLAAAAACGGAPPPSAPHPVPDTTAQAPVAVSPLLAPAPPTRLYAPVRLAFVGDINLGTSTLAHGVPPDDGRGLLDRARPALVGDLVVGNFEGVLADTGSSVKCEWLRARIARQQRELRRLRRQHRVPAPDTTSDQPGCFAFRTPTALAPRLREAGFTHLNLANNHANDFGPAGRASTEALLDSLGIDFYGPIGRIAIDSVRRGDSLTTVGLIGFTTYPFAYDLLDIQRSAAVVDSIRPLVDLLLVTFHGGSEGVRALHTPEQAESLGHEPRGELRRWAHAVIDAGADGVVGHGPHVLRGIELYRGKPIVYSLGNFLTYRGFSLAGPLGVTGVLQLEYAPDRRLRGARIVPMRQSPLQGPAPDSDRQALELVRQLSAEDFGEAGAQVGNDGEIAVRP